MNQYDIDYNILGSHLGELLNEAHHHSIKIQLNQIINNIDNSNSSSSDLKNNIINILSLIKSTYQLLNQKIDVQIEYLYSPTPDHPIFEPIIINLKYINNIIQQLNNNNNNNNNSSNNNNNQLIIIEQLQQIYNRYYESHQSNINELVDMVINSEKKPPSINILKSPSLLFTEDLKEHQVKSLQLSYDMASYNPDEYDYIKNNESGISFGSIINNKIYFKLDNGAGLLKPGNEYAIYQFYKYLYPTSTSTIISPTQIIIMDQLEILPPNHPVRKELGRLKTKHNTPFIREILGIAPEFRVQLDRALENNNQIFLQASLFRNGIGLEKYLEQCEVNNDINYSQINLESYSSHILASLLLIPTDYKPDNLILENGTNNIIGIDNDEALESFELRLTPSGQVYPRIKNILYTLKSLMSQPVHQHVRDQFIQHNPSLFIIKWLILIEKKHSNYYSLISKLFELNNTQLDIESKERRINNIKDNLNLPIHFNQGWIIQMYQRFKSIKQLLLSNTNITHQELFNQIHPLTSKYYELVSNIYSSPLDQIVSIYGRPFQQPTIESETNIQVIKQYSFNQLLDMVSPNLTDAEKCKLQHQIEQSISSNNNIKQSISSTIKELIQNTNYNDLSECTLNSTSTECLNHNCTNSNKTKSTIIEWSELVYSIDFRSNGNNNSGFGNSSNSSGSDILFHGSWYEEKESIIKSLLKCGSSVSIISNIIKSLNIIIDNNNFISIINHKDIINNNNITNQIEHITQQLKLDIEMIQDNNTLLDLASTYNNITLFIKLVDLGAGRNANPSVVNKFYQQLSYEEKSSLKSSLSKLFIINPKINWKISINQLFPLVKSNTPTVEPKYLLSEVTSSTKRIISTEIWNKLFDSSTGQPKRSNEYGTRSVILIQDELGNGIYLKFKPQFPGIELAVHDLCKQIFQDDTLTPHCELASINQIPVLLSQQVPGEPLIDILERDQNILNQIESSNISKQLIIAMLTNNADGNLANFILVPNKNNNNKYLLYSIDNDQCFMPSITKSNGILQGESLQVDTVLFLFNQMNNIVDQDVINIVKNLNIYKLLNSWLSLLKHHHQSSLDHFVSNRNQLKRDKETIVGVSFSDGMIEHLYSKLQRLIQLFNKDNKSTSITHLQILESIEPLIYNRYKQVINNHQQPSIINKYNQLKRLLNYSKQLVTCSTYPTSQILQSRAIPNSTDIQDQLWSGKYGPSQALHQLNRLNHQFENLQQLLIKLKESNTKNQNYIISNYDLECLLKADFNNITDNQQILFNYIKSKEISIINFKNNNQIDIGIIKKFNLDTIVILDLSGCNKIVNFEGVIPTKLYFKSLIKIKFNNCNQLISIKINSPNLEYISTDNCKLLGVLNIESSNIKYLSIENCKQFKVLNIDLSSLKYCNLNGSLSISNTPILFTTPDLLEAYIINDYYINRLEYLNISTSDYGDKITINSKSLKRLVMNSMKNLKVIKLKVPSIESFSIQDCESLNKIRINSKSLKCLVMHALKSLSKIKLQVPSIESFSFEGCESLNKISTIKNDKELNYNLWNLLKQMDLNRLKQMNITINMVAAKQIKDLNAKHYGLCFIVPNSGPFIIPYNYFYVHEYFKITNDFSFKSSLPTFWPTLIISGDLPQHLYKEEIPSTIKNLYLYDTYMVNTSNLDLDNLVLGYGFKNEFTPDFQLPSSDKICIGETLHPFNSSSIHDIDKVNNIVLDEYKYQIEGMLPKVKSLKLCNVGKPLVNGSIHPDQEHVSLGYRFNQVLYPSILPDKLKYLKVEIESNKALLLPDSIPSHLLEIEIKKENVEFKRITQQIYPHSTHLVVFRRQDYFLINNKDDGIPKLIILSWDHNYNYSLFDYSKPTLQLNLSSLYSIFSISSLKPPVDILQCWNGYKKPIIAGTIPQTIQYLYLREVNHPLSVGSIPPSVTHLELCDGFNQEITKQGIIPSSVKYLFIGNIVHPLNQHSIPKEVEVLELGTWFNINLLSPGVILDRKFKFNSLSSIPNTIKKIVINCSINNIYMKDIKKILSLSPRITIEYKD